MRKTMLAVSVIAISASFALGGSKSKDIYLSDFQEGLDGWRVMYISKSGMTLTTESTDTIKAVQKVETKEGFNLTIDKSTTGPSGKPSLKISSASPSSGRVGVEIYPKADNKLNIELYTAANHKQPDGRVQLAMICYNPQGRPITWINVPWMGQNHLPKTTEPQKMRGLIQIPDRTYKIALFVQPLDFVGDIWITDVKVVPFEIAPKLEKEFTEKVFFPTGKKKYGATGWFIYDVVSDRTRVFWIDDPTFRDTACKLLRAAGLTVSRTTHFWDWLEPKRREYDFTRLDKEVNDLLYYGVETALSIHGVPQWAHGKTIDDLSPEKRRDPWALRQTFFPPKNWADYEELIRKLAVHFKGRIKIWESMNEPDTNLSGFNYGYEDYFEFLRRFYPIVKSVDPDNHVMCTRVGGPWLPLLLKKGIAEYCDSFTTHPYHTDPLGTV